MKKAQAVALPMALESAGLTPEQLEFVRYWEEGLPLVIARKEVGYFLGGFVTTGVLAKEDSRGTGPQGRVAIGSCVGYPRRNLLIWLVKSRGLQLLKSSGEFLPARARHLSLAAPAGSQRAVSHRGPDART